MYRFISIPILINPLITYTSQKQYTLDEIYNMNKSKLIVIDDRPNQYTVHDVSDFAKIHPGGKRIYEAKPNGLLSEFWQRYPIHYKNAKDILSETQIGVLAKKDINNIKKTTNDDYLQNKQPMRSSEYHILSTFPFCGETPKKYLNSFITPTSHTYIRNNNPVPFIFKEFTIEGIKYNINDLDMYPTTTFTTTMRCGGDRRNEFKNSRGQQWGIGAISTGIWTGCLLQDIIGKINPTKNKYINITCADGFKISIPISMYGKILLSTLHNGKPITRDHGGPLRIIVPGLIGARNPKWVTSISFSNNELESPEQTGISYKILQEKDLDHIPEIPPMMSLSVTSAITNYIYQDDYIQVEGYALGDQKMHSKVARVYIKISSYGDSSYDYSIQNAELLEGSDQEEGYAFAWTRWRARIPIKKIRLPIKVTCFCIDTQNNIQPNITCLENIRGLNNHSPHSVIINKSLLV
uniref:Oxidoreductase molybdopterin binding domain protein n=1 Tax=Megaviridae environmental sample TaxID=1737588 RepID=A0A5J6VJ62_9VIRU|nr:MAG: oxidoreductase molybdopterin binding domain protein [Megaviridae environmental sample]